MNTSHKRALSPPEPSSRLDPHRRRCTEQVLVPRCQFQQPVTQLFDPDQINVRLGSLAMIEVQGSHRWRVPWPPISSPSWCSSQRPTWSGAAQAALPCICKSRNSGKRLAQTRWAFGPMPTNQSTGALNCDDRDYYPSLVGLHAHQGGKHG